jgi:hypothetical protein
VLYGLLTLGGILVATPMAVFFALDHAGDGLSGIIGDFLREATANAATRFVYMDLVLIWIATAAFMVVEARRLGIRHVWAYISAPPCWHCA